MKSHVKRVPSKGKIKLQDFETSYQLAEIKAIYKTERKGSKSITSSKEAFEVLYNLYDPDTISFLEESFLLLLNRANNVIGWVKISKGGTAGTIIDSKVIYALVLLTNAHGFILSHNHPSGNLKPSHDDCKLTSKIKAASTLLELGFLDHIIVTPHNGYYSFADEGAL